MRFLKFIDTIFIKLINQEPDSLNKARIQMLGYILVFYNIFTGFLIVVYATSDNSYHLMRVSAVFAATLVLSALALYTSLWKLISHSILIIITLGVWSNISIYVRDVNIETLQYIWFACALSFYMHGSKWGWFYSCLNIIPVLVFTIADNKNYFFIGTSGHNVTHAIYVFVIFYNFLLIIFLQFYFFKSFNKNFIKLRDAKSELAQLNEKLNQTVSDVEKLSNSRFEFLSTMSHELRTPLNGVIGITNVLLIENPRKDQEANLDILKFSAENLLLLINNILDVNKLDSNTIELEKVEFDLVELITRTYASSKISAAEKMLDYKLFIDPVLEGKVVISDPTRITQVLLNLINNAIKFTEKGSITIGAHSISLSNTILKVQFIVEDTGIGILPEKQFAIFEPFIQASVSTNRNYGGTGLGLPIVKKILSMFDSNINIVSEEHMGSKFTFEIDFNYLVKKQSESKVKLITPVDLEGLKVLIAEDNSINRMVIDKILKKWNIQPVIVEDGLNAVQRLEQEDFDVILMDLHMPIMDGYEATAKIRKLENATKSTIPIIALTASVNEHVCQNVVVATMNNYLSKPFNPDDLFEMLKDISDKK
ncbi:response regulator [Flavobacterium sp.]